MYTELANRLGAVAGALGTALLFVGLMLTNGATDSTSPTDTPASIAANYLTNRDEIRLGTTFALVGVFLAICFLGYLRERVRNAEGQRGWLGSVAFGGGVISVSAIVVYLAVLVAATNASIANAPETARTLLIISWEFAGVLAPAFGALVGATSVVLIRHVRLPKVARPIAWLGLPLAGALAISGFLGGFLVVLGLLWLFVVSVAFASQPALSDRGVDVHGEDGVPAIA